MTLLLWIALARTNARYRAPAAVVLLLWWGVSAALAHSGLLRRFDLRPPPMMLVFVVMTVTAVGTAFSSVGTALIGRVSAGALLAAQGFRVPLELAMHNAYQQGLLPQQMTYSGYNFEVFTCALAAGVGVLALAGRAPKWLLWVAHLAAAATLLTIMVIAVASTPMVRAFGTAPEQLNVWVLGFPAVYLPTVCVTFALLSHVLLTRSLLRTSSH